MFYRTGPRIRRLYRGSGIELGLKNNKKVLSENSDSGETFWIKATAFFFPPLKSKILGMGQKIIKAVAWGRK